MVDKKPFQPNTCVSNPTIKPICSGLSILYIINDGYYQSVQYLRTLIWSMCQIIRIKLLSFELLLRLTVRLHTESQPVGGTTSVGGCRVYLVFKGPGVINAMVKRLEGQPNKEGPKNSYCWVQYVMCPNLSK